VSKQKADLLEKLLESLSGRHSRDCPSRILEALCKSTHSYGAILWQATEGSDPSSEPPKGQLFMLATWFPQSESFGIHNLSFDGTIAGKAVTTQKPQIVHDIPKDGGKLKAHPFLSERNLTQGIALPFSYADKTMGALTIYRKNIDPLYRPTDVALLKAAFRHIPRMLATTQRQARLELLERTTKLFEEMSGISAEPQARTRRWEKMMKSVCNDIASVFHAGETNIIFRETDHSNHFRSVALKTSPAYRKRIRKQPWRADLSESSFTSFCLATGESVRIFDLTDCDKEIQEIQLKYPGFKKEITLDLQDDARMALGIKAGGEVPPLALLVVPIRDGERIHGCIRCWIAKPGLSYFSEEDEKLLELVAGQLGNQHSLNLRESQSTTEVDAWRTMSQAWQKATPQEFLHKRGGRIFGKTEATDQFTLSCVDLIAGTIPEADLNALWLKSDSKEDLQISVAPLLFSGEENTTEIAAQWQAYVHRRIAIDSKNISKDLIARVFHEGKPLIVPNALSDNRVGIVQPNVKKLLLVPVRASDRILGVLEIGSSSIAPFPDFAPLAAEFVANILGYHLAAREAKSEAAKFQIGQAEAEQFTNDAFKDIMHQMKGPLIECARRIEEVSKMLGAGTPIGEKALIASRMAERASKLSRRVGILSQLAPGSSIKAAREVLSREQVVSSLKEAWRGAIYRANPRMELSFNADFEKIGKCLPDEIVTDPELLLHVVHNLADNAVKYSYKGTIVHLIGSAGPRGSWSLTFLNKGIPIKPNEVRLTRQRGWRGQVAQLSTGEGSGIGLWIVDRILQSIGGQLNVAATDVDGWTRIRITFLPQPRSDAAK
jgi:signal transduction histidine kinase